MKRFVFLIILLTFLKLCACQMRDSCEDKFKQQYLPELLREEYIFYFIERGGPLLFLLKSEEGDDKLNNNFKEITNKLKFKVLDVDYFCNNSLVATGIVANYFKNVINLKVKNIYADTYLPKTLTYVGSSNIYEQCNEVAHCLFPDDVTNNTVPRNDDSKLNFANDTNVTQAADILNCTYVDKCMPSSYITNKVVSKNLKNYKELFALLEVLDENNNPMEKDYWSQHVTANVYKNSIVICAEKYDEKDFLNEYPLQFKVDKDCNLSDFNHSNILGIIAPKPMDLMSRLSVPSVFYDAPKILPEHKYEYPNSAVVHENYYKHLTKAAVKLIELAKWTRVGILSDISTYSLDFEILLTAALHEKNIIYNVKQCWDKTCDFHEAMKEFVKAEARIIIVNVDDQYAPQLVKAAYELGLNAKRGYMWIWRGWPFENDLGATLMGEVYSLSILATQEGFDHYNITKSNIQKSISAFREALRNYDNDFDMYMLNGFAQVYRQITTDIKIELDKHKSKSVVYLRKITPEGLEKVYMFIIADNEVSDWYNYAAVTFLDLAKSCAVRSNKFERPCDDYIVLILTLVIFTFVITIMLIHMFFTSWTRRKQRYNNL